MHKITSTWLPDVVTDDVTVLPADLNAEARINQWSFSVTPEERASLTVEDIEEFVAAVVRSRCEWLSTHDVLPGTKTFYLWFDDMAGQLRFSLVSAGWTDLPFGCEISKADLSQVASRFLDGAGEGIAGAAEFSLNVWSVSIP